MLTGCKRTFCHHQIYIVVANNRISVINFKMPKLLINNIFIALCLVFGVRFGIGFLVGFGLCSFILYCEKRGRFSTNGKGPSSESCYHQQNTVICPSEQYQEKITVPDDLMGYFTRNNGMNVKRIKSDYGVDVMMSYGENVLEIMMSGNSKSALYYAKMDILDGLPCSVSHGHVSFLEWKMTGEVIMDE